MRWGVMPFRLDFEDDPEDNVSRTFECVSRGLNLNGMKGNGNTMKISDALYIECCKHCIFEMLPMRSASDIRQHPHHSIELPQFIMSSPP